MFFNIGLKVDCVLFVGYKISVLWLVFFKKWNEIKNFRLY